MSIFQRLTLYDDLDVPLDGGTNVTCSTDPFASRPYLIHTMDLGESKVDFLEGRSEIGQVNIKVLDVRTGAGQNTGWLTALLSDGNGENRLVGRRAKLEQGGVDVCSALITFDDSTVTDISGNGNNGTLSNTPTFSAGKIGNAINFVAASNQFATILDNASLDLGTGDFTIAFWFKTTAWVTAQALLGKSFSGGTNGYGARMGGTRQISCWVEDLGASPISAEPLSPASVPIVDGQWHHYVAVRRSNVVTVYLDTVAGTPSAAVSRNVDNASSLLLGTRGVSPFDGSMDEVRIYKRALSTEEIQALWSSLSPVIPFYTVFDGVINDISLDDDNVTFTFATRDTRDNERAQPLFNVTNGSTSIHPPGITNGYGSMTVRNFPVQMIPAARVIGGTYSSFSDVNGGQVRLDKSAQSITPQMYKDWYAALNQMSQRFSSAGASLGYCYPNVIVRWRDEATHGVWHTFTNMPVPTGTFRNVFETDSQVYKIDTNSPNFLELVMSSYDLVRFFSDGTGTYTLPTNGQRVEVQVLSNLPPSELYPFWWEGNLGQLLKDIYDGVYSYTNPKIRYNSAAMTAFIAAAPTVRLRITESVPDMRPWVEENIYKPMGYAPAINQAGEVVPVSLFLPDASVTPVNLDDTNCASAAWKHTSSDSVTKVTWKWKSEFVTGNPEPGNYKPPKPIVDVINETNREDIYLSASAVYVGTKEVTYEPETFRDIGSGHMDAALGVARHGQKISRALIDRLRYGGQHIVVKGAKRSDAGIAALKVGDWVICGFSNLPDYGSHLRGMSRLAQVISIKDVNPISRDMELLDSGPSGAPLSTPTLGTVTVSQQTISVPVTAVAGTEVAIEFALSVAQPTTGSNLWQRGARGGTGTYTLPLLPVGTSVWVRARSEAISKRPSAWTAAQNVTTTDVAYPLFVDVTIDEVTQHAIVTWVPNSAMLGARVYYAITPLNGIPPTGTPGSSVDVDASLKTKDIALTGQGDTITVEVEGWTGWTGAAVSGAQGRKMRWQITRPVNTQVALLVRAKVQSTSATQVVFRVAVADPFPLNPISVAYVTAGTGSASPTSPQTILAGNVTADIDTTGFVDITVNRAAFGTGTGRITFTAIATGRISGTDAGEVPSLDRDTVPLVVRCRTLSVNNTTVVVRVAGADPFPQGAASGNIDYQELGTGGVSPGSHSTITPAATITEAAGTFVDYTITRPAFGSGTGRVTFTFSASGRVSAVDAVEVPEQVRDTQSISARVRRISESATQVVVRVEAITPNGGTTATVAYDDGGLTVSPSSGGTFTTTTSFGTTGHIDYTITRDVQGGTPRRVAFTVSASGYIDGTDGVDVSPQFPPLISCDVSDSTTQTTATGAIHILTWDTDAYDPSGLHDTVTNTSRIECDADGGVVVLKVRATWDSNATGFRQLFLRKNGSTLLDFGQADATANGADQTVIAFDTAPLASDYYEAEVQQNSGANRSVFGRVFSFIHLRAAA